MKNYDIVVWIISRCQNIFIKHYLTIIKFYFQVAA